MPQLEVNLENLKQNIEFFNSILPQNTGIISIVKANAYGSGVKEIIKCLEETNVEKYAVATNFEAKEVVELNPLKPVVILNPDFNDRALFDFKNLEFCVFSLEQLRLAIENCNKEQEVKIHINVNSGMNRVGIEKHEVPLAINLIKNNSNLNLLSLFSHLSCSDNKDFDAYSKSQVESYLESLYLAEKIIGRKIKTHINNTNGVLRLDDYAFDYVRIGIGMYGLASENVNYSKMEQLRLVHELSAKVIFVRSIKAGEPIGYGQTFICSNDMRIAVIPIGYADGIPRSLSKTNFRLQIFDEEVKILGTISMDLITIDVSNIKEVKVGTKVIIFGINNSVQRMANELNTIPYEILTNLGRRIDKVYIQ